MRNSYPVEKLLKNFPAFCGMRRFITSVQNKPPVIPILRHINSVNTAMKKRNFVA
jgi:hypothetical protein